MDDGYYVIFFPFFFYCFEFSKAIPSRNNQLLKLNIKLLQNIKRERSTNTNSTWAAIGVSLLLSCQARWPDGPFTFSFFFFVHLGEVRTSAAIGVSLLLSCQARWPDRAFTFFYFFSFRRNLKCTFWFLCVFIF